MIKTIESQLWRLINERNDKSILEQQPDHHLLLHRHHHLHNNSTQLLNSQNNNITKTSHRPWCCHNTPTESRPRSQNTWLKMRLHKSNRSNLERFILAVSQVLCHHSTSNELSPSPSSFTPPHHTQFDQHSHHQHPKFPAFQISSPKDSSLSLLNSGDDPNLQVLQSIYHANIQSSCLSDWFIGSDTCYCSWHGVNCNYQSNCTGNITVLDLSQCNINGAIPDSISNLPQLQYLNFSITSINGTIPDSIVNISQLRYLDLRSTSISGTIPDSIGNLSQLQALFLHSTNISGTIPDSIGNLSQLLSLFLQRTRISGTIPDSIGNLSQLLYLDLHSTSLSGTIPDSIGNLSRLEYLYLHSTSLSGTIPDSISNMDHLWAIDISNCRLTGFDLSIMNIPNLLFLILSGNAIGEITNRHHFSCHSLAGFVDLSFNPIGNSISQMFGCVMTIICRGCGITTFRIFDVLVGGVISLDVSNNSLTNIHTDDLWNSLLLNSIFSQVILADNPNLVGDISQFKVTDQLSVLDIHNTQLSGTISSAYFSSKSLTLLDIRHSSVSKPPNLFGLIANTTSTTTDNNDITCPQLRALQTMSSLVRLDAQFFDYYGCRCPTGEFWNWSIQTCQTCPSETLPELSYCDPHIHQLKDASMSNSKMP